MGNEKEKIVCISPAEYWVENKVGLITYFSKKKEMNGLKIFLLKCKNCYNRR